MIEKSGNTLEMSFLKHAVAEILTSSKKILVCTSNEGLVKKFSQVKSFGAVLPKIEQSPFKTSAKHNALTWDLIKNKYASVSDGDWQILNFIAIDEDNVELLHRAISDALKKVQ